MYLLRTYHDGIFLRGHRLATARISRPDARAAGINRDDIRPLAVVPALADRRAVGRAWPREARA